MEARSSAFQSLKPACINLSQVALASTSKRRSVAEVTDAQVTLLQLLKSISNSSPAALNAQLADYVFFPLSHVLRQHLLIPNRALEACLECVHILLKTAWRAKIEPKLGIQLLTLLAILADTERIEAEEQAQQSEELQRIVQQCIAQVLSSMASTADGREALLATPNLPQLGKVAFEILGCLKAGLSQENQLAALGAVQQFVAAVDDQTVLGLNFLPGLVSTFQKILMPSTTEPRSVKLLVGSMIVLSDLFTRVISDANVKYLPEMKQENPSDQQIDGLNTSWLAATASQIKTVLATIVKLRAHPRLEVQNALLDFCLTLLAKCRASLSDSVPFLLETVVCLLGTTENMKARRDLETTITLDDSLLDILRSSLYNWLMSLPRIMQSKDEILRQNLINEIATAFEILSDSGHSVALVDRMLATQVQDSVTAGLLQQSTSKVQESFKVEQPQSTALQPFFKSATTEFAPLVLGDRSWQSTLKDLAAFIEKISASPCSVAVARQLVSTLQQTDGLQQLASFWSLLHLVRKFLRDQAATDDFLVFQSSSTTEMKDILEELYVFSLELIDPSVFDKEQDWRLQALSLELVSLQADVLRSDFRAELVEALYPIVHMMGSNNPQLQNHAMACLNSVALACGYDDAKALIIENVDYLVNATALKLNTFDISAQAPQVLLMMVRLSGPSLLPYLDDLVDSMFAALDAYHGYPKLVESIFAVLLAIAQEGAKADQLSITAGSDAEARKSTLPRNNMTDLLYSLRSLKRKREESFTRRDEEPNVQTHPQEPWAKTRRSNGSAQTTSVSEGEVDGQKATDQSRSSADNENVKPPLPKTYAILLKISELTQHYLTSSSPTLRTSLLTLLHATIPALAKHENSFLPLINTLWPTVVSRLDDEEAYVVADALATIACMCRYAGDFMQSRVLKLWPDLKRLAKVKARLGANLSNGPRKSYPDKSLQMSKGVRMAPGELQAVFATANQTSRYIDAPTRLIRESLIAVFVSMVEFIKVDEDIFDDIVVLLGERLLEMRDVREVLERYNEDAIWLATSRFRAVRGLDEMATGIVQVATPSYHFPFVGTA